MKKFTLFAALAAALALTACLDDAQVADLNMTKAADNFEVERRIVFINSITDRYLFEVRGFCSINHQGRQLEVICKTPDGYVKHFAGLSDNTPYLVEQLRGINVSVYHPRITFKPQTIIPDVDFRGDVDALLNDDSDSN